MNGDTLIEALDLPAGCRVDQRVPKKLLLENGAPTVADKRLINEGIEQLLWLAALKPTTIGVAEYRDETREYREIAVLRLTLRAAAKATRLVDLVHRAVPYPLLLVTEQGERLGLSAVHKRWSQGEAGKTVLEGEVVAVTLPDDAPTPEFCATFAKTLALTSQPHRTLYGLYQHWINSLETLLAAKVTGQFSIPTNPEQAAARRRALRDHERLAREVARLRAQAGKEKQLARRVALNLTLQQVEAERVAITQELEKGFK
jgi:hypothetical protein